MMGLLFILSCPLVAGNTEDAELLQAKTVFVTKQGNLMDTDNASSTELSIKDVQHVHEEVDEEDFEQLDPFEINEPNTSLTQLGGVRECEEHGAKGIWADEIRISGATRDGSGEYGNFNDVWIYSGTRHRILPTSATCSSIYDPSYWGNAWQCSHLIDGNTATGWHSEPGIYWAATLRFSGSQCVEKIVITNRPDCCRDRIKNARVTIYDNGKDVRLVKINNNRIINSAVITLPMHYPTPTPTPTSFPTYVRLRQKVNQRFLDAYTNDEGRAVTRTEQTDQSQVWEMRKTGANTYQLIQKSSGRFLDAWSKKSHDYQVVTRTAQGNPTQEWVFTKVEGSYYRIQQKSTMRYLDAHESSSNDYNAVTRGLQSEGRHAASQMWLVEKA